MTGFVLSLVVASEALLLASLVLSIASPARRVWPPPGRQSWQYRFTWGLTSIALSGALLLGVLDWNSFILPASVRFPLGIFLITGGLSFAIWGLRTLGTHASLGLGGEFVLAGPYRWSRNPEYAGDITALIGYAVLCNSLVVLVAAVLGASWFALAPFAEEPWLRQRFGERYDEYVLRVPRFIGFRRPPVERAVQRGDEADRP